MKSERVEQHQGRCGIALDGEGPQAQASEVDAGPQASDGLNPFGVGLAAAVVFFVVQGPKSSFGEIAIYALGAAFLGALTAENFSSS